MKNIIYFIHIPKTSGCSISHTLYDAMCEVDENLKLKPVDSFNIDIKCKKKFDTLLRNYQKDVSENYIRGHYAASPYLYMENISGYSIIRDPIERLISCFDFKRTKSRMVSRLT